MAEDEGTNEGTEGGEGGGEGGNDELAGLREALVKERKASREAAKRASTFERELEKARNAGKPDEERLTEATRRAETAEERATRLEVALDKALPASLAKRLVGSTREELEADADELLKIAKQQQAPPPDPDQGRRDNNGGDGSKPATDMNSWMRRASGRRPA